MAKCSQDIEFVAVCCLLWLCLPLLICLGIASFDVLELARCMYDVARRQKHP